MAIPLSQSGLQIGITRETIYAVNVQTSMAGVEIRTRWHNAPRYRFAISIIGRAEAAGQLAALAAAVDDVYGSWGTFTMVDPYDLARGVTVNRVCRLEGVPKFTEYRVKGWWKVDYTAITVV
jgi:hypothetical protein